MLDEFRHIRAVLQVAQMRNFTRAAEALHVSQSALTVQIQQMEESLGFRVFDRGKRGVTLTSAGAEIIGPLERLLEDAQNIMKGARNVANLRDGSVVVAALPTVSSGLLPEVIADFSKVHPGIRVTIRDVFAEQVREAVLKRQADIGIGTSQGPHRELAVQRLYHDHLVVFVRPGHALSRSSATTLKEVAMYDLILPTRDSSVRELVEARARRERVAVRPRHETNYMPTALALVRSGAGVAILPESAAAIDSSEFVRVRFASETMSRQIVLLSRSDRKPSPAVAAFVQQLNRHVQARMVTEKPVRRRRP
jgi:DNA-binding transcriptional LysR family regulator